jgi:hypothetical protein
MVGLSRLALLAAAGWALLLSGCSSGEPDIERATYGPAAKVKFAGNTGAAIEYANAWRATFYDAMSEETKSKAGLSLTTIPAVAAAQYLGISGNSSREVIAGLAKGSAGLLGPEIVTSSDRDRVYLAGSQALGCVILGSWPLLVPQREFDRFQGDVAAARVDGARTEEALAEVEKAAALLKAIKRNLPILRDAQDQIEQARDAIANGVVSRGAAYTYVIRILTAEPRIVAGVDNVVAKVNREIASAEPSIASIAAIVGRVSNPTDRIALSPGTVDQSSATSAPIRIKGEPQRLLDDLTTALAMLNASTANLNRTTAAVQEFLRMQDDRAVAVSRFGACGFDSDAALSITPSDTEVSLKPGRAYNVIISGGKRPYAAVLAGGDVPDGVTLKRSDFDQASTVVTVSTDKDKTKAGTFTVAISDAADAGGILINFTVK